MKRKDLRQKIIVLMALLGAVFFALGGRLAYLQMMEANRYQTLARNNMVRIIPITAPRGEIRDRSGLLLVDNKAVYAVSLSFWGVSAEEQEEVEGMLARILARDANLEKTASGWRDKIDEALQNNPRPFEPVNIASGLSWETVVQLREHQLELPGVIVEEEPVRQYPRGKLLAHVLGYVREISDGQLKEHGDEGYSIGDKFGQAGLEYAFEKYLRGEKGARRVEVDARGRLVDTRGTKEPVTGSSLVLTVDKRLQKAAEEALDAAVKRAQENRYEEAERGAAVVLDVNTGQVLAMASYPAYSPEVFTGELTTEELKKLPLLNRALQPYPPGSVFKMVTGAAIRENNVVDAGHSISDPGYYRLGNTRFNDWKPQGHGKVDFTRAFKVSCNTYFFKYGLKVGPREIARYARQFGLGAKTGIKLPEDRAGVVPTPEYKRESTKSFLLRTDPELLQVKKKYSQLIDQAGTKREINQLQEERDQKIDEILSRPGYKWKLEWHDYDTLNMAIGQGYNMYTPLQLADYVAAIANGGTLYRPYIVRKIINPQGYNEKIFKPQVRGKVDLAPENLELIREGMHEVTLAGGTAAGVFRDFPLSAAAKTGTAEVAGHDNHALFASFVPYEKPEIAVVTLVEHGNSGSGTAGPVARDILDAYVKMTRGDIDNEEEAGNKKKDENENE